MAPRLTVVLVVYREQAYLRDCVSSVLDQSFRDIELLAVDNASPDHGPEILDELAQEEDRLVVRHLDQAVSLGDARNVGLESARGEYVWFVETTDVLPSGALAAVATRLDEAPDVLVVDHTRSGALGSAEPGPHRRLIRAANGGELSTLDDRPELVRVAADVWDKVFRREFLCTLGARFSTGRYGELTLTYPALLAAERIAALDRVCYARRRPPNAADEPRVHGTPFDVFAQYDRVFRSFTGRDPDGLASRRRLLGAAMLSHYLSVLDDVRDDRQAEFFARMSDSYRRHAGADPTEGRPPPLEARLVEQGRYRSFRALAWLTERQRAARGRAKDVRRWRARVVRTGRRARLDLYYRSQLREPIVPTLAVFAAYWYRGYSCNPRAIYEQLRRLAPEILGVWIVGRDHAGDIPEDVEYVVAGTREYYRLVARAKYFVNNVGFPEDVVKRQGAVRVHTHHGTPLKTMGLDLRQAFVAGSKMDFENQLRRWARWDYSVSQNAFSTLVWERAYPGRYETLEVGHPRNDVLVNATPAEVERIRNSLGIPPDRRAVLYAPTHREYLNRYVATLDIGRMARDLGPGYLLMPRLHYYYEPDQELQDLHAAGRILDVSGHPRIEDLCLAADVLVTDYSATMFDYAVLDRPIVIHAPDWDVYRTLRGTYFDLLAEPPGIVTTTDDDLVSAFRSGEVWSEDAARRRAAFRARFCYLDDGRAAERVVRRVWLSEQEESSAERPAAQVDRAASVAVEA